VSTAQLATPGMATAVVPSLFNDPRFHVLNGVEGLLLAGGEGERPAGALGGALLDGGARFESGHCAPFGGFDLVRERETPARVGALVDDVLAQLAARGVREAVIRCPPACHHASHETVVFALLNRGFAVAEADLSFHVDLTRFATAEEYVAALRSPARRALRHAAAEPWSVDAAGEDAAAWDEGFALLTENRAAKGRELSIDRAYAERARAAFPHEIRLLTLRHAGRAVAAALTYRVRPRVELVVAWGDAGHALERSPMNRLAYEVVARALGEGVAVLDLGTSTLPGAGGRRIPNDGLIQFKHSVGASAQVRLVLGGELGA
jgi:GNAT acetyltransferase-like protein